MPSPAASPGTVQCGRFPPTPPPESGAPAASSLAHPAFLQPEQRGDFGLDTGNLDSGKVVIRQTLVSEQII